MGKFKDFVFWLKNNALRKDAIKQYNQLLDNISNSSIKEINWEKRVALVRFAFENSPFYHKYYCDNGFNPDMLKTEDDWELVPPLEKSYVMNNLDEIIPPNTDWRNVGQTQTGGSTGTPLKFYTDKRFHHEVQAWRMFKQWRVSPADNHAISHRRVPVRFVDKLKNRALWWPTRRVYLNASVMHDIDIKLFVEEIIKNKVKWVQGYVGSLEKIADFVIANDMHITTVRMVWATSAPISTTVRKKIEKAFQCKVMNQYGCCEVWNIAMQCPEGDDMHISYDCVHVDIVDKNNKNIINEEGDILVTDLNNYVCPLIKYRLGDRGTVTTDKCECGNPLPLLKPVKGRISDTLYLPSGATVSGEYLTTLFDNVPMYFSKFQIYQHLDYSIDINIVLRNDFVEAKKCAEDICNNITTRTDNEVSVNTKFVDDIADDKGKIRYIISEVSIKKYRADIDK